MIPQGSAQKPTITLPDIPALCVHANHAYILTTDGELQTLSHDRAKALLHKKPVLVCHAPYTCTRLGTDTEFYAYDLLELFAFAHPGIFTTPTIGGLCKTIGLVPPENFEDAPMSMMEIAKILLSDLQDDPHKAKANPIEIARVMGLNGKGWPWTPFIFSALGEHYDEAIPVNGKTGLNIWKNLPEWTEDAPEPPPSHHAVTGDEARERLQKLLGHDAEQRSAQMEYATEIAKAFMPPQSSIQHPRENGDLRIGEKIPASAGMPDFINDNSEIYPHIVLAEAGTGVGKTLGYLAPASVWAEKNKGTVWVSTYTKNLQRQIDQELDRLYPDQTLKDAHVATRKGRENYLCLLNLEETAAGATLAKHPDAVIAAGIMARWTAASKDGDLTGGQYPGWLTGILGYRHTAGLSDRRGECIYSACDHYHKCFVEHSVRAGKHARIVIANHALVMISAALATANEDMPSRYVFDEGHHLFDAADSAFAAHLTAQETRDLRRWILGNEGGRRQSRARGLKRRAEDLAEGMQDAEEALRKILDAAECLPMDSWTRRLRDGQPSGPTEKFIAAIYKQVHARANGRDGPYSLETEVFPVEQSVTEAAQILKAALQKLQKPMKDLARIFHKKLTDDDGHLSGDTRNRLEAVSASLERRATMTLQAWIYMLENLIRHPLPNPPPTRGRGETALAVEGGGQYPNRTSTDTIEKSRNLRKDPTEAEQKLWFALNKRQLGTKFRRQHPIEPYIIDFIALEKNLIIEVDGGEHTNKKEYDQQRTAFLENLGYKVIRFWNNEVLENLEGVLQTIQSALNAPPAGKELGRGETSQYIDWMEIERIDGRAVDVGLYRHHIDPMKPFAASIKPHVHGMAVTSATLRDSSQNNESDWQSARSRSGASYLTPQSHDVNFESPFDYAQQTKIFVVNDVRKDDMAIVAGAYKALFEASGGGALGLFTAISRLRAVHNHIATPLEQNGLTLYSQHIDEIDAGTLVDMFREDEHACLLGTDAIRDGVDVPGESLRLIVFDRVPWPRPTILHKSRRDAFGGRAYDEMITRLKLKQAFGRLIRRGTDKGVFVMLDPMLPTRLQSAFPSDVKIIKTGLSNVISEIKTFF